MTYNTGPKIVTDGLVLCLDVADTNSYPRTGTVWYDLSGNANNGTITGATFDGGNNGSFSFDGDADYIDCTKIGSTGDISICAFIRPSSYDVAPQHNPRIFMNYDGVNDIQIILRESSKFVWGSNTLSQGAGTTNLPELNTWTHIAVTRSSSNYTIYYNGIVQTVTATTPGNPSPTSQILRIGADIQNTSSNGHFNGLIANCGIYNRALSTDEVRRNYNATKGRFGL